MLANVAIVTIILLAAYAGYQRGFLIVAADLVGFIISSLVALLTYRHLSTVLVERLTAIPSFASVMAYILMFGVVQLLFGVLAREGLVRLPRSWFKAKANAIGGSLAGVARALFLVTLFLILYAGLPMTAARKQPVTDPLLPRTLLSVSGGLQRYVGAILGSSITDTLNFLTVRNISDERVDLGFTTTAVRVDATTEEAMLRLINRERTSRGLKPLVMNQTAREVARLHSRDMFARGYFAHINPDGDDPFDRMDAGGVSYLTAGENLAYAPTLELAHNGLMNSPGHRENILRPEFGAVGIGVIDGGRYGLMFTQNFTD